VLLAPFDASAASDLSDKPCPFIGLNAFQEADAGRFFGREEAVRDLANKVDRHPVVVVFGPSGSGKSSLVLAGLLPQLTGRRVLPVVVPGTDPLAALAAAVRPPGVELSEWVAKARPKLAKEPEQFRAQAEAGLEAVPVVLVIDQFEELFSLCQDQPTREQFLAAVLSLVEPADTGVAGNQVVLVVRQDFVPEAQVLPSLRRVFDNPETTYSPPPLSAREVRRVIVQPAEKVGLEFDERVVDELVKEVSGQPTALPLLQFTLQKLWERRERNRITLETYKTVGNPREALQRTADEVYRGLIPEDQQAAEWVLLELVQPRAGTEAEFIRRRVRREALTRLLAADRVNRVLDRLERAGLVRRTPGVEADDDRFEVTHEALIRNWPLLAGWLADKRRRSEKEIQLEALAKAWRESGRVAGYLISGEALEEAKRYAGASPEIAELVRVSQERQDHWHRVRWFVLVSLVGVLLGGCVALWYKSSQAIEATKKATSALDAEMQARLAADAARREADRSREKAESAERRASGALYSKRISDAYRDCCDCNFVRAEKLLDLCKNDINTRDMCLWEWHYLKRLCRSASMRIWTFPGDQDPPPLPHFTHLVLSPDGRHLAAIGETGGISETGLVRVWEMTDPAKRLLDLRGARKERFTSVAFSADGRRLAIVGETGWVQVRDVTGGGGKPLHLSVDTGSIRLVVFSPGGQQLAAVGSDGLVRIWDIADPAKPPLNLSAGKGRFTSVAFSADGQRLAAAGETGLVQVWEMADPAKPPLNLSSDTGRFTSVAFSADGRWLAAGETGLVQVWDVAGGGRKPLVLSAGTGSVRFVVFSPRGQHLAASTDDGRVFRVWGLADPVKEPLIFSAGVDVNVVAFSLDGRRVAAGSSDGIVRVWEVANLAREPLAIPAVKGKVSSMVFSPDGRYFAAAGSDGVVRVWEVANLARGREPLTLPAGQGWVRSVSFSSIGKRLAAGSDAGSVWVWDVADLTREPHPLSAGDKWVRFSTTLADFWATGVQHRPVTPLDSDRSLSPPPFKWQRVVGPHGGVQSERSTPRRCF
jgi:WD40 repeat protein